MANNNPAHQAWFEATNRGQPAPPPPSGTPLLPYAVPVPIPIPPAPGYLPYPPSAPMPPSSLVRQTVYRYPDPPPVCSMQVATPPSRRVCSRIVRELPPPPSDADSESDGGRIVLTKTKERWREHLRYNDRPDSVTVVPAPAPAPVPSPEPIVELIKCHICNKCGRARSRKYHRKYPLVPGVEPTSETCTRCIKEEKVITQPRKTTNIYHRRWDDSGEYNLHIRLESDEEERGRARNRSHERRTWISRDEEDIGGGRSRVRQRVFVESDEEPRRPPPTPSPPRYRVIRRVKAPSPSLIPQSERVRERSISVYRERREEGESPKRGTRVVSEPFYRYVEATSPSRPPALPPRSSLVDQQSIANSATSTASTRTKYSRSPSPRPTEYQTRTRIRSILREPSRAEPGTRSRANRSDESTRAQAGGPRVQFTSGRNGRSGRRASVLDDSDEWWQDRARKRSGGMRGGWSSDA